jgi:hypothetical protein
MRLVDHLQDSLTLLYAEDLHVVVGLDILVGVRVWPQVYLEVHMQMIAYTGLDLHHNPLLTVKVQVPAFALSLAMDLG